jgi:hypothetical protein
MPIRACLGAATVVLSAATLTGCVTHPVGSARNSGIYTAKATRSAESALSTVETVRLVAEAASDGKAFGTYASVSVDGQEDSLTEITATFRSIQPPDEPSRQLREELSGLLDSAGAHVAAVRIEIRRGRLATAADVAVVDVDGAAPRTGPQRDRSAAHHTESDCGTGLGRETAWCAPGGCGSTLDCDEPRNGARTWLRR